MRNAQRMMAISAMTLTAGAVFGLTATAASAATGAPEGSQTAAVQADKPGPGDNPKGDPKGDPKDNPKDDPKGGPKGDPNDGPKGGPNGGWGNGGWGNGNWNGRRDHDRSWVAGWYPTKRTCQLAAWLGERRHRFDYGVCVPAFGRRGYLLIGHERNWRGR